MPGRVRRHAKGGVECPSKMIDPLGRRHCLALNPRRSALRQQQLRVSILPSRRFHYFYIIFASKVQPQRLFAISG